MCVFDGDEEYFSLWSHAVSLDTVIKLKVKNRITTIQYQAINFKLWFDQTL